MALRRRANRRKAAVRSGRLRKVRRLPGADAIPIGDYDHGGTPHTPETLMRIHVPTARKELVSERRMPGMSRDQLQFSNAFNKPFSELPAWMVPFCKECGLQHESPLALRKHLDLHRLGLIRKEKEVAAKPIAAEARGTVAALLEAWAKAVVELEEARDYNRRLDKRNRELSGQNARWAEEGVRAEQRAEWAQQAAVDLLQENAEAERALERFTAWLEARYAAEFEQKLRSNQVREVRLADDSERAALAKARGDAIPATGYLLMDAEMVRLDAESEQEMAAIEVRLLALGDATGSPGSQRELDRAAKRRAKEIEDYAAQAMAVLAGDPLPDDPTEAKWCQWAQGHWLTKHAQYWRAQKAKKETNGKK